MPLPKTSVTIIGGWASNATSFPLWRLCPSTPLVGLVHMSCRGASEFQLWDATLILLCNAALTDGESRRRRGGATASDHATCTAARPHMLIRPCSITRTQHG